MTIVSDVVRAKLTTRRAVWAAVPCGPKEQAL